MRLQQTCLHFGSPTFLVAISRRKDPSLRSEERTQPSSNQGRTLRTEALIPLGQILQRKPLLTGSDHEASGPALIEGCWRRATSYLQPKALEGGWHLGTQLEKGLSDSDAAVARRSRRSWPSKETLASCDIFKLLPGQLNEDLEEYVGPGIVPLMASRLIIGFRCLRGGPRHRRRLWLLCFRGNLATLSEYMLAPCHSLLAAIPLPPWPVLRRLAPLLATWPSATPTTALNRWSSRPVAAKSVENGARCGGEAQP